MAIKYEIPTIDISPYIDPNASSEARAQVIEDVKSACSYYGFLQVKGHGVPVEMQNGMLESSRILFDLPLEEKYTMSLKNNPARRQANNAPSICKC